MNKSILFFILLLLSVCIMSYCGASGLLGWFALWFCISVVWFVCLNYAIK